MKALTWQSGGIENLGPATPGRPRGRAGTVVGGWFLDGPVGRARLGTELPRDWEGALTGIGNNTPLIPPPLVC